MMAAVPNITVCAGRTKYNADGFLFGFNLNIEWLLHNKKQGYRHSENLLFIPLF